MSDFNSTDQAKSTDNIETLLAQFQNLINSERTIAEITQEANALTDQIEQYFKANEVPEKSVDSEVNVTTEPSDEARHAEDTDESQNTAAQETQSTEDPESSKQITQSPAEQWDKLSRSYRKKRRKFYEERKEDLQEDHKKRIARSESFKGLLTLEEDISNT